MKRAGFIVTALLLLAGVPVLSGHAQDNKAVEQLMQKKLQSSQKILEGITLNNFNTIGKNASELIQISKAVEWRAVKSPQYEIYSNDFRRSAETMIQAAKDKNLDGAALAYVDMTLTCVRCHKYVREVRQTSLED